MNHLTLSGKGDSIEDDTSPCQQVYNACLDPYSGITYGFQLTVIRFSGGLIEEGERGGFSLNFRRSGSRIKEGRKLFIFIFIKVMILWNEISTD